MAATDAFAAGERVLRIPDPRGRLLTLTLTAGISHYPSAVKTASLGATPRTATGETNVPTSLNAVRGRTASALRDGAT